MKKIGLFLLFLCVFLSFSGTVFAVEDPLSVPNNKVGIHILFPEELQEAAKLVNAKGDWGYVTIPIQAGDKDLAKWQAFMDTAEKLHLIPIIRLATEGDYFNTQVWRKPNDADIVDFANFLNSLTWPTKNRYIIIFNEVNRGDEWGGIPNSQEYAQILSYAVTIFKSKDSNFYIIASGMDNAAATAGEAINQYDFFSEMQVGVPGIFYQVDGLSSHSYPNPGFSQPPSYTGRNSIASFRHEKQYISQFTTKNLPIFITETGWSKDVVTDHVAATYFKQAFTTIWNDENIVAVTPFLLKAGAGPFNTFSFLNQDGSQTEVYKAVADLEKVKGSPLAAETVLSKQTPQHQMPVLTFSDEAVVSTDDKIVVPPMTREMFKWLLKL